MPKYLILSRAPRRCDTLLRVCVGVGLMVFPGRQAAAAYLPATLLECVHADNPADRIKKCSIVIDEARDPAVLVPALNARGSALCAIPNRCAEAIPDFANVLKMVPTVAGYFDNYARSLRAAKRYDEAVVYSDKAISLAPRLAFAYVGKALGEEGAGLVGDALGTLDHAIAVAAPEAGLLEYRGKLLGKLQRYTEAYAAFDQALTMQPVRASVYIKRADIEIAEGRFDAAEQDLTRYPDDGVDSGAARGRLEVLKVLRPRIEAAGKGIPAGSPPSSKAEKNETFVVASSDSQSCNFSSWTPVDRCLWEYHTENDPLAGGKLNPQRWNMELAKEGEKFAAKHPGVQWNSSQTNVPTQHETERPPEGHSHDPVDTDHAVATSMGDAFRVNKGRISTTMDTPGRVLTFTSTLDEDVKVTGVRFNRGHCETVPPQEVGVMHYGDTFNTYARCDFIEAEIITDHGSFIYTW